MTASWLGGVAAGGVLPIQRVFSFAFRVYMNLLEGANSQGESKKKAMMVVDMLVLAALFFDFWKRRSKENISRNNKRAKMIVVDLSVTMAL